MQAVWNDIVIAENDDTHSPLQRVPLETSRAGSPSGEALR